MGFRVVPQTSVLSSTSRLKLQRPFGTGGDAFSTTVARPRIDEKHLVTANPDKRLIAASGQTHLAPIASCLVQHSDILSVWLFGGCRHQTYRMILFLYEMIVPRPIA
ncbi:MAG: hypothetical protein AMJ88_06015 [Anaerolineae bacterium SM23_ 63]|nr:MAG: hypothetical protein AMJ88_06015 [Anaerolineae bacterium SM23_ 63]